LDLERYNAVKDSMDPAQLESVAKDLKRADLAQTLQARAKELRSGVTPAPPVLDGATAKARAQDALKKRDFETAVRLLLPLARKGDAWGETHLTELYMLGNGIGKDYPAAAELIQAAANQGDTRAMALLAHLPCKGDGHLTEDALALGEWATLRKDDVAALNWANEIGQRAHNAVVSPTRILFGHLYDQGFQFRFDSRPAGIATVL
jgi:TPR repeat protein